MIIYPEITLEWEGVEYTTAATFKIINKIEQSFSLAGLTVKIQNGDVPLSSLAIIYANLLRGAGVNVSEDEVYATMYGQNDKAELTQEDLIAASAAALGACFPQNKPVEPKGKKKANR